MIVDDYYNTTIEQINEGRFGNMARIGALMGSLALGSAAPAIAGGVTYPARPRTTQDMFINNLNMATNSVGYSSYIDISRFLTATETNWTSIAYDYIKKNETLGHANRCFGTTMIRHKRLRTTFTGLFGTGSVTNLPCYKTYKDTKGIITVGMGYNVKANINDIVFAASQYDWECCFDSNKRPMTIAQMKKNPSKIKYIDKRIVDAVTNKKYRDTIDKCKSSFTDWDAIPYCVRIVIVDLGWNNGSVSGFKSFVKAVNERRWIDAAKELMDSKTYGTGPKGAKARFYRNAGLILKWARTQDETKYDSAMSYADKSVLQNKAIWKKAQAKNNQNPEWHTLRGETPEDDELLNQSKIDWEELLGNGGQLESPESEE